MNEHTKPSDSEKSKIIRSALTAAAFTLSFWLVWLLDTLFHLDMHTWGVLPRHAAGIKGIFLSPFVHGGIEHLASNTIPFFVLFTAVLYFYRKQALWIALIIYVATGLLVWLFARSSSYHIGASGLIYGFAAFLFFGGIFRKNIRLMAISLLVVFWYGSMVWGVLPLENGVSWESHLAGAGVGTLIAFLFRNKGRGKDEPAEEEEHRHGYPGIHDYIEIKPNDEE